MYEARQNKVPTFRTISSSNQKNKQPISILQRLITIQLQPTHHAFDKVLNMKFYQLFLDAIERNKINGQSAYLGWGTSVGFNINNNSFNRLKTKDLNEISKGEYDKNSTVSQIVTTGVQSCTVIFITDGKKSNMSHLDIRDLNIDSLTNITRSVSKKNKKNIKIFASLIDDRKPVIKDENDKSYEMRNNKRANFVRSIVKYYYLKNSKRAISEDINSDDGALDNAIVEDIDIHSNVKILNRGKFGKHFIHPELGIAIDNKNPIIFGDILPNEYRTNDSLKNTKYAKIYNKYHSFQVDFNQIESTNINSTLISLYEKQLLDINDIYKETMNLLRRDDYPYYVDRSKRLSYECKMKDAENTMIEYEILEKSTHIKFIKKQLKITKQIELLKGESPEDQKKITDYERELKTLSDRLSFIEKKK